jgi:hypothetical protein
MPMCTNGPSRPKPARRRRLPVRIARAQDRPVPTPAGARHNHACRQGDVPNDGRLCRVRALDDPGTGPYRIGEGQERGEAAWPTDHRPKIEAAIKSALAMPGRPGVRKIAALIPAPYRGSAALWTPGASPRKTARHRAAHHSAEAPLSACSVPLWVDRSQEA